MSRTIRRKKTGAKSFSTVCSNHGACEYCQDNRKYFDTKRRAASRVDLKLGLYEWEMGYDQR